MKRLYALILAVMLTACAPLGVTQAPPTATFEDKAAIGVRTATTVLRTATALLVAKKITVEQDQVIRKSTDLSVQGIRIAQALQNSDPAAATVQLTAALATLEALKAQTGANP